MLKTSSVDTEKIIYRFILGLAVGILIGNHVLLNLISKSSCYTNYVNSMKKELSDIGMDFVNTKQSSGKVFIGMMSMDEKMDSRVDAAMNTWMEHMPNGVKVEIFANNNGSIDPIEGYRESILQNGVRVIQLPGVSDHVYPPQKKSFSMIKYMHDAYINQYDWFVRLDDDAYVDAENLVQYLSKINSSKPIYLGHAGFGKHKEDFIDGSHGENYCMGGPGMIFSRGLLRELTPHLKHCLGNLFTEHEDIEIGRCVQVMTGVKCTLSWESLKLFFQNFKGGSYANNIEYPAEKDIEYGLIYHANKDSQYQKNFHVKLLTIKMKQLVLKITSLEGEIRREYKRELQKYNWASNSYSHLKWDAIVYQKAYKTNEREMKMNMHMNLKNKLVDNTNFYVITLQNSNGSSKKKFKSASLESSYHVVNPLLSTDFISKITLSFSIGNHKMKENVYVHQRQYFSNYLHFFRELSQIDKHSLNEIIILKKNQQLNLSPLSTEYKTAVNFLTTLSGRSDNCKRFLGNFEEAFLQTNSNVNLIIVFFPMIKDEDASKSDTEAIAEQPDNKPTEKLSSPVQNSRSEDFDFLENHMNKLQEKYPKQTIKLITLKEGTEFSRGVGLQEASKYVKNENEILFFCDVDLVFAPEIVDRIRKNTVQKHRVYYPVFFSQYDPEVVYVERNIPRTHFHFDELDGFWRYFSYGMFSIYKSDFAKTKGFNMDIHGWGLEDTEMIKSVMEVKLDVLKCPDPALVHVYHDKYCDPSTTIKQYTDCKKSRSTHYGPKTLMYYLFNANIKDNQAKSDKITLTG